MISFHCAEDSKFIRPNTLIQRDGTMHCNHYIDAFERGVISEEDLYISLTSRYSSEYLSRYLRADYLESLNRWKRGVHIQL